MKNKSINIIIVGGSGFWSEQNHYPAIKSIKKELPKVKIVAICDYRDPYLEKDHPNLLECIGVDNPMWIDATKGEEFIKSKLDEISSTLKVDILIISTNPAHHFFYIEWGALNKISTLCDKPIIVSQNAAFSSENALSIQKNIDKIYDTVKNNELESPQYMLCSPLRRRALTPFVRVADSIQDVYARTSEPIRFMNVIINGGIHKYPQEFLNAGAHGYLEGIGSLSHSSYHYIDVIAWYLSLAPGNISKLEIDVPYILRVRDYLRSEKYLTLQNIIEPKNKLNNNVKIPASVLDSELDFTAHIKLIDNKNNNVGLISYTCNHSSYSPRTIPYNSETVEHANNKDGGRMSQVYFDIHQGALQNWQIIKNDVVFKGNNIQLIGRCHPSIGPEYTSEIYEDAYDKSTATPKDLFKSFVYKVAGIDDDSKKLLSNLSTLEGQRLSNRIFSKFYEIIASKEDKKDINHVIYLKEYL